MSDPTPTKTLSNGDSAYSPRLLARSCFYQLLACLFRHPESADNPPHPALSPLKGERNKVRGLVDILGITDIQSLKKLLEVLYDYFSCTSRQEWIAQYELCFGHTAYSKVPPYELEYGEEHSHRQPQELADIAAFYHAFGLQVAQQAHERADHISVECEFMSFLLYKEAYALEHDGEEKATICRQASVDFLSRHLGRWAVSFAHRLSQHAGQTLMGRMGDLALFFISQDCQRCGIGAGPSDLPIRLIQEKEETGCTSCSLISPNS